MEDRPRTSEEEQKFQSPGKDTLKDMIANLPCSALEREWILYFYFKDESVKSNLSAVGDGELNPKDFVTSLREDIDVYILEYLQNDIKENPSPIVRLGSTERAVIARNFSDFREPGMKVFLANAKDNERESQNALNLFRGRLRSQVAHARAVRYAEPIKNKSAGEELVISLSQLIKIMFAYNINIRKLKEDMAKKDSKSDWMKRCFDRIIKEKNLILQYSLIHSFREEYPNRIN